MWLAQMNAYNIISKCHSTEFWIVLKPKPDSPAIFNVKELLIGIIIENLLLYGNLVV